MSSVILITNIKPSDNSENGASLYSIVGAKPSPLVIENPTPKSIAQKYSKIHTAYPKDSNMEGLGVPIEHMNPKINEDSLTKNPERELHKFMRQQLEGIAERDACKEKFSSRLQ